MDRIALISDVHGNLTALKAVLADIDARGITRIFNLGDYVGKGPRGRECIELCQQRCEVNILGNWDDFLPVERPGDSEAVRWWRSQLTEGQGEWLRSLPFSHDFVMSGRTIRLFHASATSVHVRVRFDHTGVEFAGMFHNTPATGDGPLPTVVGYGDTHDAFIETDRGLTLFNTGSVGNPCDEPTPHYAILEGTYGDPSPAPFSVSFVRVPYDAEAEFAAAKQLGMPELAAYRSEIIDGIYRGDIGVPGEPTYHRPPVVEADGKDWTWTVEKPCADCGFVPSSVQPEELAALVHAAIEPWRDVAVEPTARRRPAPATWSPIEYAAHVRDVCDVMAGRIHLMLDNDAPDFANWDQDEAAKTGRYDQTEASTVIRQLEESRDRLIAALERVGEGDWGRTGLRSNGAAFTVYSLGQYAAHDLVHHLHDVGRPLPARSRP